MKRQGMEKGGAMQGEEWQEKDQFDEESADKKLTDLKKRDLWSTGWVKKTEARNGTIWEKRAITKRQRKKEKWDRPRAPFSVQWSSGKGKQSVMIKDWINPQSDPFSVKQLFIGLTSHGLLLLKQVRRESTDKVDEKLYIISVWDCAD